MKEIREPYQRRFRGDDFTKKILKGQNALGEPVAWVEEMLQDIKDGSALVLVASGLKVGEVGACYMTEFRVFYPRIPESVWKQHKILKYFREFSKEEFNSLMNSNYED